MTRKTTIVVLGALLGLYGASQASAAADQVVIGDIDDMSGVYADVLGQAGIEVINMAISDFGGTVLGKKITVLSVDHQNKPDIGASIASGSAAVDAMAVIPCSAGALGSIAAGLAGDLLTRVADVCLKERRTLVLCLRETPLNRIHLENMLRVHDAGAIVMPAMPAFYYAPETIAAMVEQFCYRVLAQLGLPQQKQYRWKGGSSKRLVPEARS